MLNRSATTFLLLVGWMSCRLASTAFAQNDPAFNVQVDSAIWSMIPQPDGRVMVGGNVLSLNGVPRDYIGRVNSDGSLDTAFNPGPNGYIYATVLLTNGQILLGGTFDTIDGQPHNRIARINANGTPDNTFNSSFGSGINGEVYALTEQSDGKIILGGTFTTLNGQARNRIARYNADGSVDAGFNPSASGWVYTVALQPDGKILVGGSFTNMGGQPAAFLCRLNTNGSLDTNFTAVPNSDVHALAVQPDGKILVGGLFWTMNGQAGHEALARLNADGSLDTNFNASVRPGYLGDTDTLALQCDGKILVGGLAIGWFGFPYFARFHGDGSVDTNFVTDVTSGIHSIALQRDGKILRANYGSFARMTNAPATESLSYSNSIITWLRSGSAPEAWRTTFEYSTNRTNWMFIGAGTRIAGGWQRTGVSAPTNAIIRARAFTTGGHHNSSSWFVENYVGPPVILNPPATRTNNAGTTATFTVLADGSPPLAYRWRKNGTNLTDGGNILGATNATLTLTNVLKADAAAYTVVITNRYGAITSSVANLTVVDPFIVTPPADQYANAGDNALFAVAVAGTSPLKYQWQRNGSQVAGATNATLTLTNVQGLDSGSLFRAVVTNSFGASTSSPGLLTVNAATVDSFDPLPNYDVFSTAVQPDGKILMAGSFSYASGSHVGIARLNSDGVPDPGFSASLSGIPFSPSVQELALQTDGKILLGGCISALSGALRDRVGRLNLDGSVDAAFNPGAGAEIFAFTAQPDGKLLFAGSFFNLAGQPCSHIGRLNNDGTFDTNFTATTDGTIYAIALQPDGRVIVGGSFSTLGGQSRTNLGRFNTNGTVDLSFAPNAIGMVNTLAWLTNGSIVVGGQFTTLGGQARTNLGRLSSGGVLDPAFNPAPDGPVETLAVQLDGKLVLGGTFTSVAGRSRTNIARLNTDGSADMTFNPGADDTVRSVSVQPDGKIIVAGSFMTLNGQQRWFIGRLNATVTATNDLTFNSTSITWQRTGTGPEVWKTTFDYTTNGNVWSQKDGVRTATGWQATGLDLNGTATIRARGFVSGSTEGSSWFAEKSVGPAAIMTPPVSRTNTPFTLAQFTVTAAGQPPFAYQWLKNGAPLADGGNLSGAQTAMLTINDVLGADATGYQIIVSNASMVVTSAVATLTVIDPLLTSQPASRTNNAGTTATFNVSAIGTTNLSYQWLKNGTNLANGGNISGAQTPTLMLNNVSGSHAGDYRAVVTNVWGSVTSAVATLTVIDPLLVTNPVTQFLNRGQTATFGVLVRGEEPLFYQWRKNATNLPAATNAALVLTNVQTTDNGSYDVVASNSFGSVTSAVAVLTVNIAVPDLASLALNGDVDAMALQPDGKILLGGLFTSVAGQTRNRIARLNADGTLDTTFNPNAKSGTSGGVFTFAVQPNGQILVGGSFTNISGLTCTNLARLNPDGSLDLTFSPNPTYFSPGNSRAMSLLLQPDGKIILGGLFTTVAGLPCGFIGRLHPDGSLDTNFQATADGFVTTLAAQADGRILVGGSFGLLDGQPRNTFGRLNADGSLDNSLTNLPNGSVGSIIEQPDGGILIGGDFNQVDGQPRVRLAKITPNGSLDSGFTPSADQTVFALAQQADGRILVGGFFGGLNGQSRSRIGRLNADGSLDMDFNPAANGIVLSLITQPDGRILAGGAFGSIGGETHSRFARLDAGSTPTESLFSDATSVTWLRGGGGPELARTAFETTANGTNWLTLGEGSRIPGGWRLTGLSLPPGAVIRARGFAHSSGLQSSSMWFIESIGGAPLVITRPVSRTNNANTPATFSVSAIGAPGIGYRWLKNGTNISNGPNLSGATTSSLLLSNVFGADAGGYSVVLSNVSGIVTSAIATLTVVDPLITSQPVSQSTNVGQSVTFSVTAQGTSSLAYRWRQDGVELGGATSPTLTLTNLQAANAGSYDVVVSNTFGSVTSSVATVTVNLALPDSFNPGANYFINTLAIQPDGKILVGGGFSSLGGQPRNCLGRLTPGGAVDTFSPGGNANSSNAYFGVSGLAVQPDGKIIVAGSRNERQVLSVNTVWRLNGTGIEDTNFLASLSGNVSALALQPDGKIWIGGSFTTPKPAITTNLARLFSNGSLDSNFVATINGTVNTLAFQRDGRLVIGGVFTTVNGTNRNRLARFHSDGTLDTNFNPNANNTVNALAMQPDGKILVAGLFTTLGGTNRNRIARLNIDGTVDTNFNPNANGTVNTLALQSDGRILLGGSFTTVGGLTRNRLARISGDGSVDTTFNPGANSTIGAVAIQSDGAIIVGCSGGNFLTVLGGQVRTNIGRLAATGPATQSISFDGSTATWQRDGTGPEFCRTTFEGSTNGTDWISLGDGTWITNGWQLTGTTFPIRSMIHARGFVTGGLNNGSGWFVESVNPSTVPPEILPGAGGYAFNIHALPGQVLVIEATEDFTFWTPVQTNVVTDLGTFIFAEAQAGLYPHRFYRAKIFNGTLPVPGFGNSFNLDPSGFGFDLNGTPGQSFIIETTTNLSLWTPLATNTLETGTTNFIDFGATNSPLQFYRLKAK